jgi:hypothetical protein
VLEFVLLGWAVTALVRLRHPTRQDARSRITPSKVDQ